MYTNNGIAIYFDGELRAKAATTEAAAAAVALLNTARRDNTARRYTAAARGIAKAEAVAGFFWTNPL